MVNARPTVERRQLGLSLRKFRERAGISQLTAGKRIGKGDARMSRIEDGIATLGPGDLEALLDLYAVSSEEREGALALGAQARKKQPRRAFIDSLPESFQRLADLESAAVRIRSYEAAVVPGLLQCSAYMRALFHAAQDVWWQAFDDAAEGSRTEFRARRQELLRPDRTEREFHFVLGEAALDDTVGGPAVMLEQLDHLARLAEARSDVVIQLLPRQVANNPARGGGLTLLEFGDAVPDVGFASVLVGPSVYEDGADETAAMHRVFRRLGELALTERETLSTIRAKRDDWKWCVP